MNKSQFFDGYGGVLGAFFLKALLASRTISNLLFRSDKISNKTSEVKKCSQNLRAEIKLKSMFALNKMSALGIDLWLFSLQVIFKRISPNGII